MSKKIVLEADEIWDNNKKEFLYPKPIVLNLEHSLVSISKWEGKYHKSFIKTKNKTPEEWMDYIKFMTITQNVDDSSYLLLSEKDIHEIIEYIDDPMSATYIPSKNSNKGGPNKDIPTAEYYYYLMFSLGIPKECEKWHFNKLIALIHIFEIKNTPKNKRRSAKDIAKDYAALNDQRLKALNTRG